MTGPKLNEANMVAGERSGTKASAKYLRVSAYKARVVLNLIRGLPVKRADEVLQQARRVLSQRVRRGATMSSPQAVKYYLRLEIGLLEHSVRNVLNRTAPRRRQSCRAPP